jgi:pimeloyl-ACP methyl ester carboxylesterase
VWQESNYIGRLQDEFTVITIDLRGHGESDKPTNVEAYAVERLTDDILAVADAVRVTRFAVWGYSFGGNIARYVPASSDRVDKLVIMGIPFGPAAPPSFRDVILGLRAKWAPIVEADRAGTLNVDALSAEDRTVWRSGTPLGAVPVTLAWLSAMLEWPSLEPASVSCQTLWLVGTANENAMSSVNEYAVSLERTKVTLQLVPGLTHERELTEVEEVLPHMLKFTRSP